MESYKKEAQLWLDSLRRGTDLYDSALEGVRREIQKGGLTLQDIGTSKEELEQLRSAAVKNR